jgi:hypothetical protein
MKLTDELIDAIVERIGGALGREDAAASLNVPVEVFRAWMVKGERANRGYHYELYLAVTEAETRRRAHGFAVRLFMAREARRHASASLRQRVVYRRTARYLAASE